MQRKEEALKAKLTAKEKVLKRKDNELSNVKVHSLTLIFQDGILNFPNQPANMIMK